MLTPFLSLLLSATLHTQQAPPTLASVTRGPDTHAAAPGAGSANTTVAIRADAAPAIDGKDDDAVWKTAPAVTNFLQFTPVDSAPPMFRTEAKVAYDDRYLYVLVRAYDPHPDSIVGLLSRRDVRTASDQIKIIIDSYHDRRTGYELAVDPAGVKRDYAVSDDMNEDQSWDGIWDVATRIDSLGWVAEFRIPWSQLRFPKAPEHTFGFGVWRDIQRTGERDSWPRYNQNKMALMSQIGEVSGFVSLDNPRRLEVTPYALAKNVNEVKSLSPDNFGRKNDAAIGADVKAGLSSNLTLDATINPDFGQVEADPASLNLTAFETFFQEQRPFFIEGAGIFNFALGCNNGACENLFYSRRIGRSPQLYDGDPSTPTATTIYGAGKLTGRFSNGLSVGALDAVTAKETGASDATVEPATNYSVFRAQQDFNKGNSGVGLMFTGVNRQTDNFTENYLRKDAYSGGLDFRHKFGGERYQLQGFVSGSHVEGSQQAILATQQSSAHFFQRPDAFRVDSNATSMTGDAEMIDLSKIAGFFHAETYYQRRSPGYEINDIGFMGRADKQDAGGWVGLQWNKPKLYWRQQFLNFNGWSNWNAEGMHRDLGGNINVNTQFNNQWWLHAGAGAGQRGGVFGDDYARGGPAVRRSPNRNQWIGLEGDQRHQFVPFLWLNTWQGDYGRSQGWDFNPQLDARVGSQFSTSFTLDYSRSHDDSQWYDNITDSLGVTHYTFAHARQRVVSLSTRINYTMTTNLSLQVYAQPFIAAVDYSNLRELDDPRNMDYTKRFKPYNGTTPSDFNVMSLRSNTVLRWEYRPGSTIYFVWTQGRFDFQGEEFGGQFQPVRTDYRTLFAQHPDNTFLVKASYWLSL